MIAPGSENAPTERESINSIEVPASDLEIAVPVRDPQCVTAILGSRDQHRRAIERELNCKIHLRGDTLLVTAGDPKTASLAARLLAQLAQVAELGKTLSSVEVTYAIRMALSGEPLDSLLAVMTDRVLVNDRGKPIGPRTVGQAGYIEAIRKNDLIFAIGPAGTGKTYLAVAAAVAALKEKDVLRIILTRPAVEAGERLGFLPGDLQEKVDPYLRPLYDALYDMLGIETAQKHQERRIIEVAPLAYMRGRTLNDSFVILDEAQNTTPSQMKMFLTRMGFGSKVVVTGDVTQVDLPAGQVSGLNEARRILAGIEGISFVHLTDRDVVRHRLVQRIILAYESSSRE